MVRNDGRLLDLSTYPPSVAGDFERLLAHALRDFVAELFFTEAGLLIGYINADIIPNIDDLLASSAERTLKPGTLRYGRHAVTRSDWGCPPTVSMSLEFHTPAMNIYFRVEFDETSAGIAIDSIDFRTPPGCHAENLERFGAALDAARIAPDVPLPPAWGKPAQIKKFW